MTLPALARHRLAVSIVLSAASFGAAAQAASAPRPPEVQARPVQEVVVQPLREVTATVLARNESKLAAEVAGSVQRWSVDTGQAVAKGVLLVQIDDSEYRLVLERTGTALQAAQARLALAEAQLKRTRELVAQNFLSQEALNARETEAQLARAEMASARLQRASAERALRLTQLRAPFDAHVRQRLAQTGEYVTPGTPLYVLSERGAGEVAAQLAPADVASLRASGEIVFEALGERHRLAFLRAAGTVSTTARTQEVRLKAPPGLPAGTEGRLTWRDARAHLPAALLVRRQGELGVFAVDAGKARFVALPGAQEGRAAPLPADLAPHTPIVTGGQAALHDGQPVAAASSPRR